MTEQNLDQSFHIINTVTNYFNPPMERLYTKNRKRDVTVPRQVIMYLLRKNTSLSLKSIGQIFDRDHSSVCYAKDTVNDLMYSDKAFKAKVQAIEELIKN